MTQMKRLPLHETHERLGAKFAPFAGYEMPVQYPAGVMKEHLHTRAAAGLFDVSHMGQVILRPVSGRYEDAAAAFEALTPAAAIGLKEGRQRYGLFTNAAGGVLDDFMFANRGDHLSIIVNAACKDADVAHMRARLPADCVVEPVTDRALLALQGPAAEAALARLLPDATAMRFMDVATMPWEGADLWLSRSGYTGEDGYEISVPNDRAGAVADALLAMEEVAPIGLGARDSLRLEAGLCLYGHDMDIATSPIEADLVWSIQGARKSGGAREGGFPGAVRILNEIADGPVRLRVGLLPDGRAPMREGTALFAAAEGGEPVGAVTSGGFGPTIGAPMAMGYLPTALATPGETVYGEVRGKRMPATVAPLPFRPSTYKR
ncbi:MAG: glycine cleavage system aminomethyltransferase GcvT [Paracoccaceae bacterium]